MAIKFTARDQSRGAPTTTGKEADEKTVGRERLTDAPKAASETPAPSTVGTNLFNSEPEAPARKRKTK